LLLGAAQGLDERSVQVVADVRTHVVVAVQQRAGPVGVRVEADGIASAVHGQQGKIIAAAGSIDHVPDERHVGQVAEKEGVVAFQAGLVEFIDGAVQNDRCTGRPDGGKSHIGTAVRHAVGCHGICPGVIERICRQAGQQDRVAAGQTGFSSHVENTGKLRVRNGVQDHAVFRDGIAAVGQDINRKADCVSLTGQFRAVQGDRSQRRRQRVEQDIGTGEVHIVKDRANGLGIVMGSGQQARYGCMVCPFTVGFD